MGLIKNLFSTILGVLVFLVKLPLSLLTLPAKLLPSSKGKSKGTTKAVAPKATNEPAPNSPQTNEAFFLDGAEATGVVATESKAPGKKSKAKKTKAPKAPKPEAVPAASSAAATANALNLPQPTVTASPEMTYTSFTPRRRPGANMKSYLDMAKSMKNA
jgi:hypothetical protein